VYFRLLAVIVSRLGVGKPTEASVLHKSSIELLMLSFAREPQLLQNPYWWLAFLGYLK
jgi:hypothetical protein